MKYNGQAVHATMKGNVIGGSTWSVHRQFQLRSSEISHPPTRDISSRPYKKKDKKGTFLFRVPFSVNFFLSLTQGQHTTYVSLGATIRIIGGEETQEP